MAEALLQMAHVSHEAQVTLLTAPLARKVVIRKFNLEKLKSTKDQVAGPYCFCSQGVEHILNTFLCLFLCACHPQLIAYQSSSPVYLGTIWKLISRRGGSLAPHLH